MSFPVGYKTCGAQGCDAQFKDHRWGRIKDAEGWFISRDEKLIFCPKHLPDWVTEWRKNKKKA